MTHRDEAIALRIGHRYFREIKDKRILTSWSVAGAKLFGLWDERNIAKIEGKILLKGRVSERIYIRCTEREEEDVSDEELLESLAEQHLESHADQQARSRLMLSYLRRFGRIEWESQDCDVRSTQKPTEEPLRGIEL